MGLSKHIVGVSSGIESVTGSKIVDTGLRSLDSATVALKSGALVANEEAIVSWDQIPPQVAGGTVKLTIYVWKHGTGTAVAGDTAVDVSWIAVGS